jgi:hypothetical protein
MPASRVDVRALLDELQAAEAAGAEALGHWLSVCEDPRLRGGLRVIRARDRAHAKLARARLVALGGSCEREAPRQVQSLCGVLAASEVSNRSKLTILLARFPARAEEPLPDSVRQLEDEETRALLETMHEDDRASVRWLREAGEGPSASGSDGRVSPAVAAFLDAFRAAEEAGAAVLDAWRAVCSLPGLRGGLDTIAERERAHAELVATRLTELGVPLHARVDDAVVRAAHERFGAAGVADDDKLAFLASRHPDDDAVVAPLRDAIEGLDEDPETAEMLRLVAAGEIATFAWLRSYGAAVLPRAGGVSLRVLDGGR